MRLTATLLAALPLTAAAGTQAADSAADSTAVELRDIVVTATRADAKTPVAYTNITKAELRRLNSGVDMPSLLQMTPSVITTSDAGTGIGYSSMRVRGSDGARINVTANGIPINNPESHNVYWVNMPDLASSLRDVQIQRGAGTSTNGAAAFGASINMVTDAPSTDPYAELSGSYGMYNTHKETIRLGSGLIADRWSFDARLSNIGSDGYIDRASTDLWSYFAQGAYSHGGTMLRLLAFGGKEKTYMAWDYASREQMERYGRRYNPCGQYTDDDGNTAYYPDQTDNYVQHHFQLLLSQTIGSDWQLNAALHYTKDDGFYRQYKTRRSLIEYGLEPFATADGTTVTKSDLIRLKKNDNGLGGGVFSLTYRHSRVNATFGGGLNRFSGNHFGQVAWVRNYVGPIDPDQEYYRNRGLKTDGNIYLRASVDITGGLSAYADLQYRRIDYRIDGINDTYDYNTSAMQRLDFHPRYNFFNPKAGLNYTFGGAHRAFASWTVAHREPMRDNFTDGDPQQPPRPERMFDYELGYTFTKRMVSAGINFYYMDYKDQLVLTGQLSDTGNPMTVNVPRSYRAGIELQGALHPCPWFDWNVTATFSRNRIHDFTEYIYEDEWTNPIAIECGDTPIAFSPDITVANSFAFNVKGFDAQLSSRYVSRQYMTNAHNRSQSLDPYFVSDLTAGYTFTSIPGMRRMRVALTVYNIFNEQYESNGYAGSGYTVDENGKREIYRYAGFAAQAPIHVTASMTLSF